MTRRQWIAVSMWERNLRGAGHTRQLMSLLQSGNGERRLARMEAEYSSERERRFLRYADDQWLSPWADA